MKTVRTVSIILLLLLLAGILPLSVFAEDSFSGKCGDNITWRYDRDDDHTLYITGSGPMYDYTPYDLGIWTGVRNSAPWRSFDTDVWNIVITGKITSIGEGAFAAFRKLETVQLPSSLTSIGAYAFRECPKLKAIDIPNSVRSIGVQAFMYCTGLESAKLPDSITEISEKLFYNCSALAAVDLPEKVTVVRANAFFGCQGLMKLTLSDALTVIEEYAFNGCDDVTEVILPDGLVAIGDNAFGRMYRLASIAIPDSVTSIGGSAFSGNYGMKSVTLPATQPALGGSIFSGTGLTSVTIPEGYTDIGTGTFSSCESLKEILLPDSLTTIGNSAFHNCRYLPAIEIPKNVTTIGQGAFESCYTLKELVIPDSVTSIGKRAFYGCSALTGIRLPRTLAAIEDHLFYQCTSLTDIVLPDGLSSIGSSAFAYCESLSQLTIPASVTTIGGGAFNNCVSLKAMVIPDTVTTITGGLFGGCTAMESVTLPASLTVIGNSMFSGCVSLTALEIPAGVTQIDYYAFNGCTGLTELILPDGLTRIGHNAFRDCTALKQLTVPAGVTAIEAYTFRGCTNLTTLTLPDSIASIGEGAFQASGLTHLVIPEGVTAIPKYVFQKCGSLVGVTLPASLESVDNWAFDGCAAMWHVSYNGSQEQWSQVEISNFSNYNDSLLLSTIHFDAAGQGVVPSEKYTCTSIGLFDCTACGQTLFAPAETVSHSFVDYISNNDATCAADGTKTAVCEFCDASDTLPDPGSRLEHTWSEPTVDGDTTVYTCTACAATLTEQSLCGKVRIVAEADGNVSQVFVEAEEGTTSVQLHTSLPAPVFPSEAPLIQVTIPQGSTITLHIPLADPSYGAIALRMEDGSQSGIPQTAVTTAGVMLTLTESCTIAIVDKSLSFPDIQDGYWAKNEIAYITARGIMGGKLNGTFAPGETITRKTVAMILWRIMGSPEVSVDTQLTDVHLSDRYTQAICWAEDAGIITGYADGTFRGDGTLTRQHFAVMLYRFAQYTGLELEPENTKALSEFSDCGKIYGWAQEAAQWAVNNAFINGRANGTFDPQGNTSRAQLAVIMARFLQKYYPIA